MIVFEKISSGLIADESFHVSYFNKKGKNPSYSTSTSQFGAMQPQRILDRKNMFKYLEITYKAKSENEQSTLILVHRVKAKSTETETQDLNIQESHVELDNKSYEPDKAGKINIVSHQSQMKLKVYPLSEKFLCPEAVDGIPIQKLKDSNKDSNSVEITVPRQLSLLLSAKSFSFKIDFKNSNLEDLNVTIIYKSRFIYLCWLVLAIGIIGGIGFFVSNLIIYLRNIGPWKTKVDKKWESNLQELNKITKQLLDWKPPPEAPQYQQATTGGTGTGGKPTGGSETALTAEKMTDIIYRKMRPNQLDQIFEAIKSLSPKWQKWEEQIRSTRPSTGTTAYAPDVEKRVSESMAKATADFKDYFTKMFIEGEQLEDLQQFKNKLYAAVNQKDTAAIYRESLMVVMSALYRNILNRKDMREKIGEIIEENEKFKKFEGLIVEQGKKIAGYDAEWKKTEKALEDYKSKTTDDLKKLVSEQNSKMVAQDQLNQEIAALTIVFEESLKQTNDKFNGVLEQNTKQIDDKFLNTERQHQAALQQLSDNYNITIKQQKEKLEKRAQLLRDYAEQLLPILPIKKEMIPDVTAYLQEGLGKDDTDDSLLQMLVLFAINHASRPFLEALNALKDRFIHLRLIIEKDGLDANFPPKLRLIYEINEKIDDLVKIKILLKNNHFSFLVRGQEASSETQPSDLVAHLLEDIKTNPIFQLRVDDYFSSYKKKTAAYPAEQKKRPGTLRGTAQTKSHHFVKSISNLMGAEMFSKYLASFPYNPDWLAYSLKFSEKKLEFK